MKTVSPIIGLIICALAFYTFVFPPTGISFRELAKTDDYFSYFLVTSPILMIIIGFVFFKFWIWPLADEVYDDGYSLTIKRSSQEINLPVKDIEKIYYNSLINPPIITLTINRDTLFGRKVRFIPIAKMLPFSKHDLIKDLITRIESQSR